MEKREISLIYKNERYAKNKGHGVQFHVDAMRRVVTPMDDARASRSISISNDTIPLRLSAQQ
jgi:sigma54-dependent transcription regulator